MNITPLFNYTAKPIRLAGKELTNVRHICAFFHSKEEERANLMPFIKEGLEQGEKAFHIIDPLLHKEHVCHLHEAGINVEAAQRQGQLEICSWENAYLKDGYFDQNRMLALIQEVLKAGKSQGFPLTRLVANMEWALEDRAGVRDIIEYESRLNYILPDYQDPVICTYDLAKFDAAMIMDILRTHPIVMIGSQLHENPFYMPPNDFIHELRARNS